MREEYHMIPKISALSVFVVVYLVFTVRYLIQFNRIKYFSGWLKGFHILMMWMVPFLWIILLKGLFQPTPASCEYPDKKGPDSMSECGKGIWIDPSTGQ